MHLFLSPLGPGSWVTFSQDPTLCGDLGGGVPKVTELAEREVPSAYWLRDRT